MEQVFQLDLPPGEKLVLLCLADRADDHGHKAFYSVETISKRTSQGERTVRRALKALEEKGLLTRRIRNGTSSDYHVHPCQIGTPAEMAPLPKSTQTPAKLAPNPSRTIPKEAKASSGKRARAKRDVGLPADIPAEQWAGYVAMRRSIGKPITPRARTVAISRLRKLAEDGWPPGDVLDNSTMNSWQGLFAPKDKDLANAINSRNNRQAVSSRGTGTDPLAGALALSRVDLTAEEAASSDFEADRRTCAAVSTQRQY